MKIKLGLAWELGSRSTETVPPLLLRLLNEIDSEGSLSSAAINTGVSYRTAWNLINHWSGELDTELLVSRRGKGASLSPLAAKLIWAESFAGDQVSEVLDATTRKINTELGELAIQSSYQPLAMYASHCLSHNILQHLFRTESGRELRISNMGSSTSLKMLQAGKCTVAGFHLADGKLSEDFVNEYRQHIDPENIQLIYSVKRNQGLILARGNPKKIRSVRDLARDNIRIVNRQTDSGTRLLFDALLAREGISGVDITGYNSSEVTHSAVSAQVATGAADVAIGTQASAVQFGLDFVQLAVESYYYAVPQAQINSVEARSLQTVLSGPAWHQAVAELDGYNSANAGKIIPAIKIFS